MFDQAQLRKGTLEGCILKIIDREPTYGYAIATTLRDSGFADLTEGTLYPLLLRLERRGLLAAALLSAAAPAISWAETAPWPSKPIRIVVAYPGGGVSDTVALDVCPRPSEIS